MTTQSTDILAGLNSVQKQAVETLNGPLLILAGAGTGKTRVLTSRIVNILNQHLAKSSEILAVTFTNKAAKEMKERVEHMLGNSADGFWIGTFHSIGLRILRRHIAEVGLKPNFIIIDSDDCEKIIKEILQDRNIDIKKYTPSSIAHTIGKLKDKGILHNTNLGEHEQVYGTLSLSALYRLYQERLKELNSVDFGDLLLLCVDLFRQFPDILEKWQYQFKYILVDEYQDTNSLQYMFIRILALKYNNVCCVGDDDQSIYSWRGAEISNILRFEEDFVGAKVLRLEQNYRSTTPILKVASSLIANNSQRWDKTLWSENVGSKKVKVYEAFNSKTEADFVANTILNLKNEGVDYKNIAILVRASHQSRELEERLIFKTIPYKFIGGSRFYDRQEIKDAIAYLRLLNQEYDDMAYLRIINTPKRGIGASSVDKIRQIGKDLGLSLYSASKNVLGKNIISNKTETELNGFIGLFEYWKATLLEKPLVEIAKEILSQSGYLTMLELEKTEESKGRLENLKELFSALKNYESLEEFLEHVSLVSDKEEENQDNKVSLMTMHGAKGLEFDVVFLSGWEEGIIPSHRSIEESGELGLQEERRLAYVGITRAKKDLYISYCNSRYMYGNWQNAIASRFIGEMNEDYVEKLSGNVHYNPIYKDNYLRENLYGKTTNKWENSIDSADSFKNASGLKIGQKVEHNALGSGVIVNLQGPIATVKFENGGEKKIMSTFLKML